MKETKQQQYKFDEFEQHVSLNNIIPAGNGKHIELLKYIAAGIQSGSFRINPSLLIVGEGAKTIGIALGNTICSEDIRKLDSKYFFGTQNQKDFFENSYCDTVHILSNIDKMGMFEGVLWHFLRLREYKFTGMDKTFEILHVNGIIILTAKTITSISPPIINALDFKIKTEPYTQEQLEQIVSQRLKFCSIHYESENVLKAIVAKGSGELKQIIDLLKMCILLLEEEGKKTVTEEIVEKAVRLIESFTRI